MITADKFPDNYPTNFVEDILPKEAKEQEWQVYRVCKTGKIDDTTFLSTFQEVEQGIRTKGKTDDILDAGYYSTSCNLELESAKKVLKIMMRKNPKACLCYGTIVPEKGVSQKTIERKKVKQKDHIDWWIYKDAVPNGDFKEVDENETE